MELQQFIFELRSRKVYRTAAVYSAGAWALLQVADVLFPVVGLPDWAVTAVLVMAALGFPLALVLSWLFELTPEGVAQTQTDEAAYAPDNFPVSRIIELTLILMLCALVGYLYLGRLGEPQSPATQSSPVDQSIAVMPFINLSEVQGMGYLGDGLAEEILNLLAKLNEFKVAARTSSFYFKDKEADIQTIGRHLGVSHVLEGSVRFQDGRVRVTAQLIKSEDGFHLWSENYDRELGDVLALQDEIAAEVVKKLQVLLSPESSDRLSRQRDIDPVAYDYYLRARAYMRMPMEDANVRYAIDLYDKAIVGQPDFADAHAGQCDAYLELYSIRQEREQFNAAERACQKALTLDRRAVAVYVALGHLYRTSGQNEQAINEFNTALAMGADGTEAYLGMGETYHAMGETKLAEQHFEAALNLQPRYWHALMLMGNFLLETRRVDEALPYYELVSELMPDSSSAFNNLGAAYLFTGDFEAASEAWRKSLAAAPSEIALSNMGTSLFFLGRFDDAAKIYHQALEYAPEAYEIWGNLGDAYRHTADGKEMSAPMYGKALELAQGRLEVNASDAEMIALMAHYAAAMGNREEALRYLGEVADEVGDSLYVAYSTATAYASLGERDRALMALEQAIEAGFPRHVALADANLGKLKGMPRFEVMLVPGE